MNKENKIDEESMNKAKELRAVYGDLMIQFEIIQNKILEVKKQIIDEMNTVKKD